MTVAPEVLEEIERNAKVISRRYKRRCWWLEVEDVKQEAIGAQLQALSRFDATRGTPIGGYLWGAALNAARRAVHKASAPVSHSHRTERLLGLFRAPLTRPAPDGGDRHSAGPENDVPIAELTTLGQCDAYIDELVIAADIAGRVRARMVKLLGEDGAEFALGALTDEWTPREIAAQSKTTPHVVYRAQQHAQAVLRGDEELFDLWRGLP